MHSIELSNDQTEVLSTLQPPLGMLPGRRCLHVPRSPRAKLAQPVRVRPFDPLDAEEVCVTENLSKLGFYFETSMSHYFSGMSVGVTRNFTPGDPVNR